MYPCTSHGFSPFRTSSSLPHTRLPRLVIPKRRPTSSHLHPAFVITNHRSEQNVCGAPSEPRARGRDHHWVDSSRFAERCVSPPRHASISEPRCVTRITRASVIDGACAVASDYDDDDDDDYRTRAPHRAYTSSRRSCSSVHRSRLLWMVRMLGYSRRCLLTRRLGLCLIGAFSRALAWGWWSSG